MAVRNFRDLTVWQKGAQLTLDVYEQTSSFPDHERFGLTSQLRRAAVSIPSNVAEGHVQSSDAVLARHLETALGSAAELDTQIYLAHRIGYLDANRYDMLRVQIEEVMKMLHGFLNTVRSHSQPPQR